MEVGDAHPRRKNFITLEAVELLILNFCVASKTFLKQHRPTASAHAQITYFKTFSGTANLLIAILERYYRFSGLRKAMDLETF